METDAFRSFQREITTPAGLDDINDELGMLPVLILALADLERTAADFSQQHVCLADGQLTRQETIGGAAFTATTALMKHHFAMLLPQALNQCQRAFRCNYSFNHIDLRKKGIHVAQIAAE